MRASAKRAVDAGNANAMLHRLSRLLVALLLLHATEALEYPSTLTAALDRGMLVPVDNGRVHVLGTVHAGSASAAEAVALCEWIAPDATVVVEATQARVEKMRSKRDAPRAPRREADLGLLADLVLSTNSFAGACFGALVWLELRDVGDVDDDEESEFEAAVAAAGDRRVIGADWDFGELTTRARRVGWREWLNVFMNRGKDPIKRRPGESASDWIDRRRSVECAAESCAYQARTAPALHRVLVSDRDRAFAEAVPREGPAAVVVGLAHVPGVVRWLKDRS